MADPIYVVTLKSYDDLDGFYSDMNSDGYKIHMKRPISRNTQYYMTDAQAVTLRNDSRVLAVEKRPEDTPGVVLKPKAILSNVEHQKAGEHRKSGTFLPDDHDWGKMHCAGTDAQRRKGTWGWNATKNFTDAVNIFNDGRHVDVVVCDQPVSFDCAEWLSTSLNPNQTRFVQYEWYNNLNTYVSSLDDDSNTLPTGTYPNYIANAANTTDHGTHVAATIAGKHYGWAPEANIYSLQTISGPGGTTPVTGTLIFDYVRAFHRYKPINPVTGRRNATVTNHSYGWGYDYTEDFLRGFALEDIGSVTHRGTTYSSNNPPPSGWTLDGINTDLGFGQWNNEIPWYWTAMIEDAKDAVEEGVICIGAASNDNLMVVPKIDPDTGIQHVDWENRIHITSLGYTYYYNQGSAPCAAPGFICVGSQENDKDFTRSDFSNYGPRVDIWAPGGRIVSAANNTGTADTKYGGDNWFTTKSGTSMASPQVAGIATMLATNKYRLTSEDIITFMRLTSKKNDMYFDQWETDAKKYFLVAIKANGSGAWVATRGVHLNGNLVPGVDGSASNKTIYMYTGDTIDIAVGNDGEPNWPWLGAQTGHPFYIKTTNSTGTGDQVNTSNSGGNATNQGTEGGSSGTEVIWTPTIAGTYWGVCGNHSAMQFKIEVLTPHANTRDPSTFRNYDCKKGSIDEQVRGVNPRPTTGYIGGWYTNTLKGLRNTAKPLANRQLYPRPNGLHEGAPGPLTYTLAVGNSGSGSYTMTGHDRNSAYTAKTNPVLTVKKGDTLKFEMNAAGHPMWIQISQSTGQPSGGNIPSGLTNNGTASGATITWDTSGVTAGTYYYNCEFHSSMTGTIFVNA